MSKTQQVLSKTLILPAIGSCQYLAAVNPELITANGVALRPYIDTPDKDLAFNINSDGTIDIYNVSGRPLASGKRIVVTAIDKWFNAPVGAEQTVTTVASYPTTQAISPNLVLNALASDSFTFSNTPVAIPFDASSALPLIASGYVEDPGVNAGVFVIKKPGNYEFNMSLTFSATAGGAGTITVRRYINGAAQSIYTLTRSVNFTGGVTDRSISYSFQTAISQAVIDAGGGSRTEEWRIFTSAGTITGKLGGSAATNTQSCSMLLRLNGLYPY